MEIRKLEVLNILKEMAGAMLNHRVDDEFYDYYMLKELNWLIENRKKIINDGKREKWPACIDKK